jgi:hypothetical protein
MELAVAMGNCEGLHTAGRVYRRVARGAVLWRGVGVQGRPRTLPP